MENRKMTVKEADLETIDTALDAVMVAKHILRDTEDDFYKVAPEAVASVLSLAFGAISDVVDRIRLDAEKEAQP